MPRTSTSTPTYEPEQQYRVELSDRVEICGQWHFPGDDLVVRGDVLATVDPAKVANARPL